MNHTLTFHFNSISALCHRHFQGANLYRIGVWLYKVWQWLLYSTSGISFYSKRFWYPRSFKWRIHTILQSGFWIGLLWSRLWEGREGWIKEDRICKKSQDVLSWFWTRDLLLPNMGFIKPIRENVRKNSLVCKFLMLYFESLIVIGWTN